MILDTDEHITEQLKDYPLTPENLVKILGCKNPSSRGSSSTWEVVHRGKTRHFELRYVGHVDYEYEASVYVKHYCDSRKVSWISFGRETAHTISELLAWFDAEDEFYKDHPEEKEGTPEYAQKQDREAAIAHEFEKLRKEYNKLMAYNVYEDSRPRYSLYCDDDATWCMLYAQATKNAYQKHPELWS